MQTLNADAGAFKATASQYLQLTKPRIVMLAVFCSLIGMLLGANGSPGWQVLIMGNLGIGLLAGAGFAFNCLVERGIDARMARTRARPLARGEVSAMGTLVFAGALGGLGALVLLIWANALTMWLTLATFVGYAVIYTVLLKPATPQNIVIGGASGAMPPVLGWAAVANEVTIEPMVLFLIIFVWTPPHFWALAIKRQKDYARAKVPMLPVTHGIAFTKLHIMLYTVLLVIVSIIPFLTFMSGTLYLVGAIGLGGGFAYYAWKLYNAEGDEYAMKTFGYSIFYLTALFAFFLADHYLRVIIRHTFLN